MCAGAPIEPPPLPSRSHGTPRNARQRRNRSVEVVIEQMAGGGRSCQFRRHSRQYFWLDSKFGPSVPVGPITFTQPFGLSGVG